MGMFKKYQLKNGLQVLLVESHKSPVLSIQMWVKTGSADEGKGEEGISHFIEHLVFKGSRKFGVGEIASTVEGAGGELNAYTSFDQTVFYVTISKEFQNVGLEVISEMMGFPKFDAAEIDNEREVVIEEIKRSNDSPHRQASRLLFSSVYKKHPYGIPVIGYPELIKTVSREVLVDYYEGRYNPKTMFLVVTGDFESADMKKRVTRYFGEFKPNKLRHVKRAAAAKRTRPQLVVEHAKFNETILHLAFPSPKASHQDIAALEMFALILGQGDSSRLNRRLRLDQHLVNYAGSSVFVAKDPGFFAVSMSLNEKDLEPALQNLKDELIAALNTPVSDEELQKALINLASEQYYAQETVDGLARTFGHYQDLFDDPGHFATFMRQAEALTAADLMKVARKVLSAPEFSLIIMTPAEKSVVEPIAQAWMKQFRAEIKKKRPTLKRTVAKRSKKISFAAKAPKGKLPDVEKVTLKNGVTLITRPNFDTPLVSVRAASLGGSRLETTATQGATELLGRTWLAGGGALSEHEINLRADRMAASLAAFGGRNSEGVSMTCLKPFTAEMLEIFGAVYRDPHFEEAAVEREIKSMLEHIKLRQDNPAQLCVLAFMKNMFGDHPYGHDPYGDEAAVAKLNAGTVREVFAQKSGLTIVASGAFEPAVLREQLAESLGDLKVSAGQNKLVPIAYPKKDVFLYQTSAKEQSHLLLGYPGLKLGDETRYTLQVMQAILAGQGGRLFLELRDKASLAYSVSPMRMEGLEGGYFGAYIGCSPEKAEKALRMMHAEFKKLCDVPVGELELQRAQRYLIGKHDIESQKNTNFTSSLLFDEIYGIDYRETFHFNERIRAVTSEGIRTLAQTLFARPAVTSLIGPQKAW